MEATPVRFTKTVRVVGIFIIIGILLCVFTGKCDGYSMENYCNDEFSFIWKTEYQVRLKLNDNNIYEKKESYYPYSRPRYCETNFEAWITRYPKFMFYFEELDLDCDKGHLEFYIGKSTDTRLPGLDRDICGADKPQGVYTVDKRYFRIKYVPKRSQYINDIFSIIITTYGPEDTCPSYAHVCANSRCIDDDLVCNGNNSCGDNSGCDFSTAAIVGIVIGGLVGLALLVSVVVCCICCTRRSGNTPGTVQNTPATHPGYTSQVYNQPMYGVNQGSPYNPSQSPCPLANQPVLSTTDSSQQENMYIRPIYGFNQGTNQAYTVSSNSDTNQQQPDVNKYSDPPPQYSEIFANSEQSIQHP